MKSVRRHVVRFKLAILSTTVLIAVSGCAGEVPTPDESACKQLRSVEKRLVDAYNNSTNSSAQNIYLQELGSQATSSLSLATQVQGISDGLSFRLIQMGEDFITPIYEELESPIYEELEAPVDAGWRLPKFEASNVTRGDVIGYEQKTDFSIDDISSYFAKVTIACG
jgi:hypothetical protein